MAHDPRFTSNQLTLACFWKLPFRVYVMFWGSIKSYVMSALSIEVGSNIDDWWRTSIFFKGSFDGAKFITNKVAYVLISPWNCSILVRKGCALQPKRAHDCSGRISFTMGIPLSMLFILPVEFIQWLPILCVFCVRAVLCATHAVKIDNYCTCLLTAVVRWFISLAVFNSTN